MPVIGHVVRGRRVVVGAVVHPAAIHIADGRIQRVTAFDDVPEGWPVEDCGELVVMPGLVDAHVHINDPGRTHWEGFETATRAAAAGGVTTLVDMPLNSIPATTTTAGFAAKREAASGRLWVDAGFWGGVIPGNARDLAPLWEAGVLGFKCFLTPSGVEELPHVIERDLRAALPDLARCGTPLLAHAELAEVIERSQTVAGDRRAWSSWLASRPPEAELEAISLLLRLSREFGVRLHIVHLSSSFALPLLRLARAEGVPVTVETCPHYLTFASEDLPAGATQYKCAPPLRGRANRERLWSALAEGLIDLVASDHSPCPPEMKQTGGDLFRAWGGIASLQLQLPAVWTEARRRGHSLADIARWMSAAPARLAGLERRKGAIAAGRDADLTVWDPEAEFVVDQQRLEHRHKLTPYHGRTLQGVVQATFLRGMKVFEHGDFAGGPRGEILERDS